MSSDCGTDAVNCYITDAQVAVQPPNAPIVIWNPTYKALAARWCPWPDSYSQLVFLGQCQQWIGNREVLYETPQACGVSPTITVGNGAILSLGPQGANTALQIGNAIAPGFSAAGIGEALGIAGAVAGPIIGIISGILQHHAVAVKNEQQTLCAVSVAASAVIPEIDNLVRTGQITTDQGVAAMQQLAAQLSAVIDQGIKIKSGNSGDNYKKMLSAHADFAAIYYPYIAPAAVAANPGSPTSVALNPAEVGVGPTSGPASSGSLTGNPAQMALSTSPNWVWLAAAAVLLFALIFMGNA